MIHAVNQDDLRWSVLEGFSGCQASKAASNNHNQWCVLRHSFSSSTSLEFYLHSGRDELKRVCWTDHDAIRSITITANTIGRYSTDASSTCRARAQVRSRPRRTPM